MGRGNLGHSQSRASHRARKNIKKCYRTRGSVLRLGIYLGEIMWWIDEDIHDKVRFSLRILSLSVLHQFGNGELWIGTYLWSQVSRYSMWKMSWCEVTKFGQECHWRCFLEIAKGWNIDIPLERGNPYDSNGATYVQIHGILREIWPFYGKLPEMESLCASRSGKDFWHRLKRRTSALFIRKFYWINLHSQFWK